MNQYPAAALESAAEPAPEASHLVVPDLIGLGLEDACSAAAWAGSRISVTKTSRGRAPWGVVVAQSPSPGSRMKALWQIHVLISARPLADEGRRA